jgi:hypothetical protein
VYWPQVCRNALLSALKEEHKNDVNQNKNIVCRKIFFREKNKILIFFLLGLSSSILFLPLFLSNNWYYSHDGIRYLCLFEQLRDAVGDGFLYPRWLPDKYGGYGYPDFVFYQPGFFYAALFFSVLIPDIIHLFYFTIVFFMFIGLTGTYLLLKKLYGERGAMIGALIASLTPYIFVNIYVRGDLAEYASMMLLPWPVYFFLRLNDNLRAGKKILLEFFLSSVFFALLILVHPFTAMFFYPVFLFLTITFSFSGDAKHCRRTLLLACLALVGGAVMSSPYWLTAFLMKQYVAYGAAVSKEMQAHLHLLSPEQLVSSFWGFGGSEPGSANDGMSFQLGLPHLIMASLGALLSREKTTKIIFSLYLLLVVCMLEPCAFLWKNIPLLNFVQFPWRILSVIYLLQAICVGAFCAELSSRKIPFKAAIFSLLMMSLVFFYREMFFMRTADVPSRDVLVQHRHGRKFILASYSSFNEFFPSHISKNPELPRGDRDILVIPKEYGVIVKKLKKSGTFKQSYIVSTPIPLKIRVLQFYFPGMTLKLNYKDVNAKISDDGTFTFAIPAGEHQLIELYYAGPPFDFPIRILALSGFISLLMGLSLIEKSWRKKNN